MGRCSSLVKSMLSDRCNSAATAISEKNRTTMVTPSHTNITTGAVACFIASAPASTPPTMNSSANPAIKMLTITTSTAARPLPRVSWLRESRQRSQRIARNCSQFMSLPEPAQLLRLDLFAAHRRDEAFLQRTGQPHLLHRRLINQLAAGDDAHVGAKLLNNLQHVRREEHRRAVFDTTFQDVPQHARRNRVHAFKRFVEKQQIRRGTS